MTDGIDRGSLRDSLEETHTLEPPSIQAPVTVYQVGNAERLYDAAVDDVVTGGFAFLRTPFTLTDSTTDPNRNGQFEEPLPAGTYSGAASNTDAITVDYKGGFRGARGPYYFLTSMRAGYRFQLRNGRSLQAHLQDDPVYRTLRGVVKAGSGTQGGRDEAVVASFHARRIAATDHLCPCLGAACDGPDERPGDGRERSGAPGRHHHGHSD